MTKIIKKGGLYFLAICSLFLAGCFWFDSGLARDRDWPRRRAIVYDVKHLVDACKSIGESSSIKVRGKALVWDLGRDTLSDASFAVPRELRPDSSANLFHSLADGPTTVFMIVGPARQIQVGNYSISNSPAYKEYVDVAVAYWPEKAAVGMVSVLSAEPRYIRKVSNLAEYGDPSRPIADWIATLPRARGPMR